MFSPINQGSDDLLDSDFEANGQTPITNLALGEIDPSWDLGLYAKPATLGNFVWIDANKNGLQDVGEAPVKDVIVQLHKADGALVATDTTDAAGLYLFENLQPGEYYLQFVTNSLPNNYSFTTANVGTADSLDSDADALGKTAVTTLEAGEIDLTWDLGITSKPASVGNFVWYDSIKDGFQQLGEAGVANVIVELRKTDGSLVATDTTNADGLYLFENVNPDEYYIQFVTNSLPNNYLFTTANAGVNDEDDSDADANGKTPNFNVAAGEQNLSLDLGIAPLPASLGNYVWIDANKDGLQQNTEGGVQGVIVELYDIQEILIKTDTTDATGLYLFENLKPGEYFIQFVTSSLPTNYVVTTADSGSDDAADSDANTDGKTVVTTLEAGENDMTWDLGIAPNAASIGDYVWIDANKDGIQQNTEGGVAGIIIELKDAAGTVVSRDTTDADGKYLFENVNPSSYTIELVSSSLPMNYEPTTPLVLTKTLAAGEQDLTKDFGIAPNAASIGDYVWIDANKDGIQDASELPVPNAIIELKDAAGTVVSRDTTDADGKYLFENVNPSSYTIELVSSSL
ncbi:MAG: hypothetical protein HC817_11195, partial [Saprospiraceae bacterium]|nr:hypothetical protein [Saprospiraceae bacterium]